MHGSKVSPYCVYTLSDSTGIRFVGVGETHRPLYPLTRIRNAGLTCGVNDWIDSLAAKGETVKLARVASGVDAVEADKASKKLCDRLGPGLLNLPRVNTRRKGTRCVAIIRGRARWFKTYAALCRYFGVGKNGVDVAGRALNTRRGPCSAGACGKSPEPAAGACCRSPEPAAGARSLLPEPGACCRSPEPAAGKKPQKPRKNRHIQRFRGALILAERHYGGISARV